MELRLLRAFMATADTLHFGRAAENLRVAQPALSQQIQRLEADVGLRLFDRDKHSVALTAAGQVLLREARSILAQVQHAEQQLEQFRIGGAGTLRLGYVPGPTRELLPRSVQRMRRESPGVKIELQEAAHPHSALELVRKGMLDLALTPELSPPFPRGLVHLEVDTQTVMVAMRADHPLARKRVVPLKQLAAESWIIYDEKHTPSYRRWLVDVCSEGGFVPKVGQRVTSSNDLQLAIEAGSGVALLMSAYQKLFSNTVVFLPLHPEPERLAVWAWHRRGKPTQLVNTFLKVLVAG